jgi:hypothetical protein
MTIQRYGDAQIDEARKLVTCTEIIDADRWRGTWRGQHYECRSLPDTTPIVVGDAVLCHVLPGNGELVAVFPENEILYLGMNNAGTGAELWQYTGSGDPTLVWALGLINGNKAEIDSLCWCQATKTLFCGCYNWGTSERHILEWTPGTAAPILRYTYPGENWIDAPIDWAEYNGKLYVLHSGEDEMPGFVCRFTPNNVAATFETVLNITSGDVNIGEGGFLVFPTEIYAMTSENIWSSATGASGSWAELVDLPTVYNCHTARGAVTDPISGNGYFTAVADNTTFARRQIWRLEEGGLLTMESDENSPLVDYRYSWSQIAIPYGEVNKQPQALQWQVNLGLGVQFAIYRRDAVGVWNSYGLFAGPGEGAVIGGNQAALYFKGKLHVRMLRFTNPPPTHHQYLYQRDATGTWSLVYEWSGYCYGLTYSYGMAMTLGRTSKLIQNI